MHALRAALRCRRAGTGWQARTLTASGSLLQPLRLSAVWRRSAEFQRSRAEVGRQAGGQVGWRAVGGRSCTGRSGGTNMRASMHKRMWGEQSQGGLVCTGGGHVGRHAAASSGSKRAAREQEAWRAGHRGHSRTRACARAGSLDQTVAGGARMRPHLNRTGGAAAAAGCCTRAAACAGSGLP